jgi:glyoxylase-like metal-dependent hydrolase (beta-lactamase superfamily II)
MAAAPSEAKPGLQFLADLFAPYVKAGKFAAFDGDLPLASGIRALATHGHTQGHKSYVVESGGQTLVVLGDLVHVGAVQFLYPSVHFGSDADPKAAIAQRMRVFQMAADSGYWVAGAHLSFPGIGHLRAAPGRYLWVPAIYTNPLD